MRRPAGSLGRRSWVVKARAGRASVTSFAISPISARRRAWRWEVDGVQGEDERGGCFRFLAPGLAFLGFLLFSPLDMLNDLVCSL